MTESHTIAFADWRDPLLKENWSGTSATLAQEFNKRSIDVIGLACRPPVASLLLQYGKDRILGHDRGYTQRRVGRRNLLRLAKTLPSDCKGIIHMNAWTVPPAGSNSGFKHYMLLDSLCEYWRRNQVAVTHSDHAWKEYEEQERESVRGTDHFFSISEHIKELLIEHYAVAPEKITVVGTGRGKIAPLQGDKDYSGKNVLMVAKQRFRDKGVDLLVKAIQIARQTDPEITLTLVSPIAIKEEIGDVEGVTVTGTLAWEELQKAFDTAALYAMPARREPWGLVYAEALATKTPILALNKAAIPELTNRGEFGFLAESDTPEAIAEGLLFALSDTDRLLRMGNAGQQYVLENFSWERTTGIIVEKILAGA